MLAGPISVAIHIQDDESHEEILAELHELYRNNALMKEFVDLHLIVDKFDRQFNMWRNVAKFFARTDYIVMLGMRFPLYDTWVEHVFTDLGTICLFRCRFSYLYRLPTIYS